MLSNFLCNNPQFGPFKSIIVLDGDIGSSQVLNSFNHLPLIAIDGAANKLKSIGFKACLILGDLDGIDNSDHSYCEIKCLEDQNFCDFEKSLRECDARGLLPSIILGLNGGYLDRIAYNLFIFKKLIINHEHNLNIAMTDGQILFLLTAKDSERNKINLPWNTKISLLSATANAKLTTRGLKWDLLNSWIGEGAQFNSLSNRTIDECIEVNVLEGEVFVFVYLVTV